MIQIAFLEKSSIYLKPFIERVSPRIGLIPIALVIIEALGHACPKSCSCSDLSDSQKKNKICVMLASKIGGLATILYLHSGTTIQKISLIAAYSFLCFCTHFVPRAKSNCLCHQLGCGVNMALEVVVKLVNAFILGAAVFKFVHPVAVGFVVVPAMFFSLGHSYCNWILRGGHLKDLRGDKSSDPSI